MFVKIFTLAQRWSVLKFDLLKAENLRKSIRPDQEKTVNSAPAKVGNFDENITWVVLSPFPMGELEKIPDPWVGHLTPTN